MGTHNLPQYTTPLIGRETEIADVGDRLRDPNCRLLTLVGPGGIGKTRLAIEATAEQESAFQDGIVFVALQPVASADNIVRTMGSAIGFEFSADSKPEFQLQQHLHEKDQLLILDNVEHLLEGAEIIAGLVAATTGLKLLVTSREPLKLQDEWLYHVQGLPFPRQESSREIETYDAVRLFTDHAGRVQRDFSLDEERAPVIRICQLVQGMPLGIELAAKWRRLLPSVEIARELQNSLDILQTDLRDVPDRHRSMRAVFDHSWKLLTDEERHVLMALSVFRGGFRHAATAEVVGATLTELMSLVDKSLLRVSSNGRYEIHELLRQYAEEKLNGSPRIMTTVRKNHSAYYTRFMDRPVSDFLAGGNQETLRAIDAELDNFRAAWSWAVAHREIGYIDQAIQGLYWYTWRRSWHGEGERAFRGAVDVLRDVEPAAANQITLSRALYCQAAIDIWFARAVRASERAQESVTILRSLDARGELAQALTIQGWATLAQGDRGQAKTLLEEAIVFYETDDRRDQMEVKAFTLSLLGHIARDEGDYTAGERWYQRALQLGRQIDDQRTIAEALGSLARIALWQGEYARARRFCTESLAIAKVAEITPFIMIASRDLSTIALATGQLAEAQDHAEEGLRTAKEIDEGPAIATSLLLMAHVKIALGEIAAAQEYVQQAMEIPPGTADRGRYAAELTSLGRIALKTGDYPEACQNFESSLTFHREMNDTSAIIDDLVSLARIALAQGEHEQSRGYLLEALRYAIEHTSPPGQLDVFTGVAELFVNSGNLPDAVRLAVLVTEHPAGNAESRAFAEGILKTQAASLIPTGPREGLFADGQANLSEISAQLLEQLSSTPLQLLLDELSKRELEVLHLVAAGRSNREIAQDLTLAVGTVKTHLHNILQKLDASNRTQAVARARELNLL